MTHWLRHHGPEGSEREREQVDPVVEGARHGLSPELACAVWERACADATDAAGRFDAEQARRRFHDLATRLAARKGRIQPDPGRLTRVGVELDGTGRRRSLADELAIRAPGRETMVIVEARRRATMTRAPAVTLDDAVEADGSRAGEAAIASPGPPGLREVTQAVAALQLPARSEQPPASDTTVRTRMSRLFELVPRSNVMVPSATAASSARPAAVMRSAERSEIAPDAAELVARARRGGAPLDDALRARLEAALGTRLDGVRVHTGGEVDTAARALGARAFASGDDVFFGDGAYEPHRRDGQRLIAHEVAHTVQARSASMPAHGVTTVSEPGDAPEREADAFADAFVQDLHEQRRPGPTRDATMTSAQQVPPVQQATGSAGTTMVMRQATTASPLPSLVRDAIHYLREMASLIAVVRAPGRGSTTSLNQTRVARYLQQARSIYEAQLATLRPNDPLRVELRAAYIAVLEEIRRAADAALAAAEAHGGAGVAAERGLYAENLAAWIEANPMTSAGLSDTTSFVAGDATQAAANETSLEAYLDGLLQRLPGLNLAQPQKDEIFQRIQVALRRAFVTVSPDAAGMLDLRAIDNPRIVDKYRRLVAMLQAGIASPAQMSLITDQLTLQAPPDPVPDVTSQLAAATQLRRIDLQRVPPAEIDSVRWALVQVDRNTFAAPSTVALRNAHWPLTLPVRHGASVTHVRYELVFDANSNVRVERLGPDHASAVAPAFSALPLAGKITSLVADFGLRAIVGTSATRTRAAAHWTGPELDQIKAVFDRLPVADRAALRGVTLVRDHVGPVPATGGTLEGFAHTAADAAHDDPAPPASPPPHIHYYDSAFAQNAVSSVGPPGGTGAGGDFTIAHEVGHMRISQATMAANAAIGVANTNAATASRALNTLARRTRLTAARAAVYNAWLAATAASGTAILSFNQRAIAGPPDATSQQALANAQTANTARDAARAALAPAGVPAPLIAAAARVDASRDALLAASQMASAAGDQIPIFVSLATRFGLQRFTDYARRGGDAEWFAETFSLFITDPDRLSQMSRGLFLWFQANMPQNRNWAPPSP